MAANITRKKHAVESHLCQFLLWLHVCEGEIRVVLSGSLFFLSWAIIKKEKKEMLRHNAIKVVGESAGCLFTDIS